MVKKILFLLENTHLGGNEQHALNILQYLDTNKFESHVLITTEEGKLTPFFREYADRYVFNGEHSNESAMRVVSEDTLHFIRNYAILHDIDLVHVFNGIQNIYAVHHDMPKIMHLGGDYIRDSYFNRVNPACITNPNRSRAWNTIDYVNSLKNTLILTDCRDNAKYFKKFQYYRNFVPFTAKNHHNFEHKRRKTVAWVGRDSNEKRPETVFKLARIMPDYTFHIVISTPSVYLEHPDNVITHLNVVNKDKIHEILAISDVFINTSDSEGFPISITEAMQNGCFTIGVLGVVENVEHQVAGVDNIIGFKNAIEGFDRLPEKTKDFYRYKAIQFSRLQGADAKIRCLEEIYKIMIEKAELNNEI